MSSISPLKKFLTKREAAHPYPWRLFAFTLVAGIAASLTVLPYLLTLVGMSGNELPISLGQIVTEQILQSAIILVPAVGLGWLCAQRVKLDAPYIRSLLYGTKMPSGFPAMLGFSLLAGFVVSTAVAVIDLLSIREEVLANIDQVLSIPVAWRFLTAFYGAIDEEILMRLFLLSLIAWITWKIRKDAKGGVTTWGMWTAIGLSTFIFALSHLPLDAATTGADTVVVLRALALNGVAGLTFGWLYWKKGLESAMIAHWSGDITLQILVPAVLSAIA